MAKQQDSKNISRWFTDFATMSAGAVGSPWAFLVALASIAVWAIAGPAMHFSETWQLIINSWTNLVTFVVVFLIQNSQNRDSKAINLKLDELIRSARHASDDMINIEHLTDQELQHLAARYERIREEVEERKLDSSKDTADAA